MPHGGLWEMSVITQAAHAGIFDSHIQNQDYRAESLRALQNFTNDHVKAYGNGTFRVKEK